MKRYVIFLFMFLLCGWTHGSSLFGAVYYLSPTGSDSANGLTPATAWASPNHSVNCGDVLKAATGSYASANFFRAKWGIVSNCPSPNGIYGALVDCVGPAVTSCSIADTTLAGMIVDQSNWAVRGWAVSSTSGPCFDATPSAAANIRYIVFINVVAINCIGAGVNSNPWFGNSSFGVDQIAAVGVIAYNAAQGSSGCGSGVSIGAPRGYDSSPGTHIFLAGIFSIANLPPSGCGSGLNQDGEGIILDTLTGYAGQSRIEQSMLLANGGSGVLVLRNDSGSVSIGSTTSWGNLQFTARSAAINGELAYNLSGSTTSAIGNIFQATLQTQNGNPVYGAYVNGGSSSDTISGNVVFGVAGQNTQIAASPGFSYGSNTLSDPQFVNPNVPSAPNCSGFATTTACMATTIANFVADAGAAAGLGYQSPAACAPNSNYPVWLKGIVPNGIITKPCGL